MLHEHNDPPFSRPMTPGTPHQIGFVGLGSMGYFMARNLATKRSPSSTTQPPLFVWNRSKSKAEKLQQELGKSHIRIAQNLAQIATECDVVITNLANDEVVKSVYEEYSKVLTVSHIQIPVGL
jgi:3-hydroxyisobutyrate dehydrogenase-like beta-hydroxyacid dehydrogenase